MIVKLGIVGCGAIAERMHIPAVLRAPNAQLTALIEPDYRRLSALQRKYDVPYSARDMNEKALELDAIVLCTPPHLHARIAISAFETGIHVLCEKPLANSVDECEAMIAAATKAGRILAAAHLCRFYPSREAVKRLIQDRLLGRILSVSVEQGDPFSWQAVSGYSMRRELSPGGVLIDSGIHPLDTLLWWFGDPVAYNYEDDALGGLESNVRLQLEFPDMVKGYLHLSRTCKLVNEFRVEAEKGTILLPAYNTWQYGLRQNGGIETRETHTTELSALDCAVHQITDFVDCIRLGGIPRVPAQEAMRAIRLVEECYRMKRARALPMIAPVPGLTW